MSACPLPIRHNLQRFIHAQHGVFEIALAELQVGSKQTHWMWFIFPQLVGLGRSPTAQFYAISGFDEARAYLEHPVLGPRLRRSVEALMLGPAKDPPCKSWTRSTR